MLTPSSHAAVRTVPYTAVHERLPGWETRPLWLVVIKGFAEEPLILLTTRPLAKNRKTLWWLVEAFFTRWRIEDTLRFAKHSYRLQDARVPTYESLKNLMALALAAMYFTLVELGQRAKLALLCHHALRAAKHLFGIPGSRYCALSGGIREICAGRRTPPFDARRKPPPTSSQPDLFGFAVT